MPSLIPNSDAPEDTLSSRSPSRLDASRRMPRLPAEIWLQIFLFATWIPGAFTVSDYNSIAAFTRDRYGDSIRGRFRSVMDVKLVIALVCKEWNRLAAQTLFEHFFIETGSQALRVATMLGEPRRPSTQRREPGWWTRRVDLAVDGVHIWTDMHTAALVRIFRSCPNLAIFSTAFSTVDAHLFHTPIFDAALSEFDPRSKLRRLELKGDLSLLNTALSHLSAPLEALWILPPRMSYPAPESLDLEFPNLKILLSSFSDTSGITRRWRVPALQTLLSLDFSDLQFRIERNGRQLLHLSVPNLFIVPQFTLCPNLEDLELKFDGTLIMPINDLPMHASIRRITVDHPALTACCAWNVNDDDPIHIHHLRSSLLTLAPENFPALECIRFVLPGVVPHPGTANTTNPMPYTSPLWTDWLCRCAGRGIRVFFSKGADNWTADVWKQLIVNPT